jgi:hypothetical protein
VGWLTSRTAFDLKAFIATLNLDRMISGISLIWRAFRREMLERTAATSSSCCHDSRGGAGKGLSWEPTTEICNVVNFDQRRQKVALITIRPWRRGRNSVRLSEPASRRRSRS